MEKTCFVIMGYQNKQVPFKHKILNLDITYKEIIKPVLIAKHYVPVDNGTINDAFRADEFTTSRSINTSLVDNIINADLAIVDVSCYNSNAIYELGVRHALKAFSTIILCDTTTNDRNIFFDIKDCPIIFYEHNGTYIEDEEVARVKHEIEKRIDKIENQKAKNRVCIDSPIKTQIELLKIGNSFDNHSQVNVKSYCKKAEEAFLRGDYKQAETLFKYSLDSEVDDTIVAHCAMSMHNQNSYIKTEEAYSLFEKYIDINTTTNTECLGIYSTICRKKWAKTNNIAFLDEAINSSVRGYYIGDNLYCGRNYLCLLLTKATLEMAAYSKQQIINLVKYLAQEMLVKTNNRLNSIRTSDDWDISNKRDFELILGIKRNAKINNCTPKHVKQATEKGYKELKKLLISLE